MTFLKKVKPTKRYLITKQRALKKHWRGLPKEEKTELRRLVKILATSLLALVVLYYIGINLLTNVGSFWAVLRGRSGEFFQKDTIAPPPPYLSPLPLYTNKEKVKIEGYAEAGSEVTLFVNDNEAGKTVAEKGGQLTFPAVPLNEGENQITATAKDGAGNVSLKSSVLKIIFDDTPPKLTVNKPKEKQQFSGENNKIRVSGKTEPGVIVRVNDLQATVLADGNFTFVMLAAREGEVKLIITATDRTGNETKKEITVIYSAQ
ncbi:hypothetical protein COT70_00220 [candidate division WWE3 bacterium CG09_land_8_20_14_0_10_47_33]|uniref:Bacterial Ig-like domain-containing protein n=1 Tax=candidate division WWE3 bacterium CG_4_9_14_0_2_um_filter_48_10 TaxID=1975078 RepID=A0A2M8EIM1_UNCKA|nr:MAG: hypothetical protein COT70_00220 [candidate division WWE3 bacterium CG09_land_8_20_14_0_10_47_33]PIZ41567.1 MAG: hypothetical protein COY35_00125 [candidate division WWE3 bacterium CG_4_10_14_0_2_um_filter_47_8]PJC22513.1 MAG: hypothetical protein CO059_02340 [candidate division WWE3 bacterium CG_4_9_14_0_2_um_filter_48_10]PJE52303.1 MAG: hypothetical protein COV28_00315 [candidate division WWE3 bacterium CG10_big_fil_rev_8_21_14_0_10_48_23]